MKSCSVFVLLSVLCIVSSWHPLHKRQDQGGMCSIEKLTTRICTNGYYEDYAYIAAECNQPEVARSISGTCRVNENGVTCANLNLMSDFEQFTRACGSSLTGSTCSDECSNFLTMNRARYGCCVNILNDTLFLSSDEAMAFSYSLWSRCGVELVTEECAPSSFVMPAGVDPACTEEVLNERLTFRVLCRTEFLDDLRDLAASCGENVEDLDPTHCAVDENGNYCSQSSDIYSADFTASNNCANTSVCDTLCIRTLTNLTNTFGCCFITEFNSTSTISGPRDYLSYEFWEMCGLTSPGFCNNKFDDSPTRISAAVVLEIPVLAVLLATLMALTV